jgi:hypothetical protein
MAMAMARGAGGYGQIRTGIVRNRFRPFLNSADGKPIRHATFFGMVRVYNFFYKEIIKY